MWPIGTSVRTSCVPTHLARAAYFGAPTAAFDMAVGELMANAETWAVAIGCMLEAWPVGRAQGV